MKCYKCEATIHEGEGCYLKNDKPLCLNCYDRQNGEIQMKPLSNLEQPVGWSTCSSWPFLTSEKSS